MKLNYIDIHSHLNFSDFDADREEILARMHTAGLGTITVGTDIESSRAAVALADAHEHIFATVGVHPTHDALFDDAIFAELAGNPKVVAVGECGLDYFRLDENNRNDKAQISKSKQRQRELFVQHIEFARTHNLPLMIHGRPSKGSMDAYEDILATLAAYPGVVGNVHFFAGSLEIAKQFLERGFTMSFDGPVTFTDEYNEVIRFLPQEAIMAETDAPFAAPAPFRGKRNNPEYVVEIVKRLAEVRGEDENAFREATVRNALRVFGLASKAQI